MVGSLQRNESPLEKCDAGKRHKRSIIHSIVPIKKNFLKSEDGNLHKLR